MAHWYASSICRCNQPCVLSASLRCQSLPQSFMTEASFSGSQIPRANPFKPSSWPHHWSLPNRSHRYTSGCHARPVWQLTSSGFGRSVVTITSFLSWSFASGLEWRAHGSNCTHHHDVCPLLRPNGHAYDGKDFQSSSPASLCRSQRR